MRETDLPNLQMPKVDNIFLKKLIAIHQYLAYVITSFLANKLSVQYVVCYSNNNSRTNQERTKVLILRFRDADLGTSNLSLKVKASSTK